MCGDFNAPRGRATFARLASTYADAIPAHHTTSIDASLHRAGQLNLMVDGLFHTAAVSAREVTFHPGVSDHYALTATLTLA